MIGLGGVLLSLVLKSWQGDDPTVSGKMEGC